jgi:hypothetical protein
MCSGACVFVVFKPCPWVRPIVSTYLVMAYLVALLTCVPPTMVDLLTSSTKTMFHTQGAPHIAGRKTLCLG